MRRLVLGLLLCVALMACGTPAATTTPRPTIPPTRSPVLSAQRVIDGLNASGTVRVADIGNKIGRGNGNTEEVVVLLYVGPVGASSAATTYVVVAPPGTDMAALKADRLKGIAKAEATSPLGSGGEYLVAQDRNTLLFLGFVDSRNPESDRATVEAALRAIP